MKNRRSFNFLFKLLFLKRNINLLNSKKGLGPVIATSLLLVVAVVAVNGFSTWFNHYQSGINSDVETKSSNGIGSTQIETLVGDVLYFKNGFSNLNITLIKIGSQICSAFFATNYSTGMLNLNVSGCVDNVITSTPNIIVFTDKGIFTKSVYLKSLSNGILCPTGFIQVPALSPFTTSKFCVMKYEAKNDGSGVAISTANDTPWVSINQTESRIKCSNLGTGYHLITNAEWMSIARNAEANPLNWNSSIIGTGFLYSGHNDNEPINILNASINDSDGYYQTNQINGSNQRRTFILDNGEIIWDLSGNVWEWNNDTVNMHPNYIDDEDIDGHWNTTQINATFRANAGPSNSTWGSAKGMGYLFDSNITTNSFIRGGNFDAGMITGIFALTLSYSSHLSNAGFGFRCSYSE